MTKDDYTWAELGGRIRDRRTARGLTQQALARAADLTQNSVSRLEAGEVNPQLRTLQQIAAALDCSVRDLICGPAESESNIAEWVARLKRVIASGNPAAIAVVENGLSTAELLMDAAGQGGRRGLPPIRLPGEGRHSVAEQFAGRLRGLTEMPRHRNRSTPSGLATKAGEAFMKGERKHDAGPKTTPRRSR